MGCESSGVPIEPDPMAKLGGKTPYEAVTGRKPYLGHLHLLGCKAFADNVDR